jgi:2-polyprenyl-3-methyl-5-hydroxy-6-metoxy-1,4-benzoquinol methylase
VISIIPTPSDGQLAAYYAVYSKEGEIHLSKKVSSRNPNLRRLFHYLSGDVDPRDFVAVRQGSRVLDYGCGHAGYLADFHECGVQISGAEISDFVVEACRVHGLDVRKVDDFDRIPFCDSEFDIVYLMQVFEHIRNPHGFMDELKRVLKQNGTLYLAVPNSQSIWRKIFGKNWVSGWFAPFHLFHYDRNSLARLARQHGFEPLATWSRTPESWFRLNLKAFLYPAENKLDWRKTWLDARPIRYVLMLVLSILELPVRERDCLVMKLEKRG